MTYPFTAIVGMDDLRLALVLNAVSPDIGGVLVRGEKGTAKSTAVRALAAVLPPVSVVAGCRFSCSPSAPDPRCPDGPHTIGLGELRPARLVELPVGATEDRLVGSLDLERALVEGVKSYEPGLLAAAHRGVLYVDEVNLLHDHLVDLLLDAAAMGRCYVEREGVSVQHAARFLLVGTMNPEEGELRPQLLDRFGLTVSVAAPADVSSRAEVVRRRLAFDAAPDAFASRFSSAEAGLAADIATAQTRLPSVLLPDAALRQIASVCAAFGVDGMRADIVIARAALAHAAWVGRSCVETEDVRVAARLALPHRRRRNPFDAPGLDESQLDDALADADQGPEDDPDPSGPGGPDSPTGGSPTADSPTADSSTGGSPTGDHHADPVEKPGESRVDHGELGAGAAGAGAGAGEQIAGTGATFRARRLQVPGVGAGAAGRRSRAMTDAGRTVRAEAGGPVHRVHLPATLLAAAPHQRARGRNGRGLVVARTDLRAAVREGREGNLVLFVVDASGSMAARSRMSAVKGAVLSLLLDAYQRRDKVGLITFRGSSAEVVLPPTSSVDAAAARLAVLPTGGRTPLAAGLVRAAEVLRVERMRDPARRALVVLVTDGKYTSGPAPEQAATLLADVACVVVDCESGPVRLGMAGSLGAALDAEVFGLEALGADPLADLARGRAA